MKRIVCARKSTLKLMAALKTAGEKHLSSSKEDNLAQELESEYNQLVDHYEKTVESLRGNKTTAQYESDFTMFWNFITKAHDHQKRLWMKCKDLQHLASLNSNKLSSALKNAQSGQESVEELKKALEAAWLTVDTTNAREQVAQETIEALRLQVGKLKSELDMKNRMLQSETDGPAMKNKEMLAREKERSQTEVMNLKQKLEVIKSQQAELESKKTSTENKVQELLVDIENKDSELAREVRLRQGVEEELKKANKKILTLNDEVTQLNSQLELTKKAVAEIETNLKQVTAINEHIVQKNEALSSSLIKAQTDLQNKSVSHDAANQRIAALVTQMKMLDEDLRKVNGELRKTNKMRDTFQRRIQESEAKNNLLVQDRERLRLRLVDVERERDIIIKEKEQEIKARKALVVELEVVNNNLLKATAANYEEAKNRKIQEQQKKEAELILESAREELSKLKVAHNTIEKDKEKLEKEIANLKQKLELTLEDGQKKDSAIKALKKELDEVKKKLSNEQLSLDAVRAEKNSFCKHLYDTEEQLAAYKQKLKVLNHQAEQQKDDIKQKESQLMREQSKLQKIEKEKDALFKEIVSRENELKDAKQIVTELTTQNKNLNSIIAELCREKKQGERGLEKMITERDVLNTQLMKKTEEVEAANKKIESLQDSLQKGETQYTMRLDDIRLLKLEVVKLRSEKTALRRSLASLADSRQHIFNLERDLAKERVKCRALEEELQNPLNIHRWRKLEGSDPECYQLINKMQLLQKRVLSKTSEVVEKEEQLKEAEELYADLKTMLSRRPPPDLQDKFKAVQLQIQQKNRKIQALTGQLEAAEAQASEYKVEVERCRIELDSFKKKYYQQKHNIGKLRQKSMDDSSSALSTNLAEKLRHELEKPKSSRGAKIAGGGFSMILTPPRTVNKSSTISRIK